MGAKSPAELAIRFFRPLRHPSKIKSTQKYELFVNVLFQLN